MDEKTIVKYETEISVENGGLMDKSEERTKRQEETKEMSSAKEEEENKNVAASSVVTPVLTVLVLQGQGSTVEDDVVKAKEKMHIVASPNETEKNVASCFV